MLPQLALAGLLALSEAQGGNPRMSPGDPRFAELDRYVRRVWEESRNPSLAIRIIRDGGTVYESYLGQADIGRGVKPDSQTVYKVYSVTKVFTATAVLMLHERGLIDLHKSIDAYLPELRFTYKGKPNGDVTVLNLLTHRTGLKQDLNSLDAHLEGEPFPDLAAQLSTLVRPELACKPGGKSRYSNSNYLVLGRLIERVTGQTYEEFVSGNLLQPLGMQRSHFLAGGADGNIATGYISPWSLYDYSKLLKHLAEPFRNLDRAIYRDSGGMKALSRFQINGLPFGGLNSTVEDLSRFVRFNLDSAGSGSLLSPVGRRLLHKPEGRFAMGWFVAEEGGTSRVFHRGNGPGFDAEICLIPSKSLGFVVLSNNVSSCHIGGLIVEKFLSLES